MEREKFFSTTSLLKDLKKHEKCLFMVCGRGRCQDGRGFGLKWQTGSKGFAEPGKTG
jgi:hypothetical protein